MRKETTLKRSKISAAVGLLAAWTLVLTGCSGGNAKPDGSPEPGGSSEYKIGITKIEPHPSLDAAAAGFKQALADAGVKATYEEQDAQGDQGTQTSIAGTFASSGLDLVLAISTPSAQAVAQAIQDKPVLFTAVTDPVDAKLVASNEAPGANVTGTTDMNPVAEQIALIKKLRPKAKSVGILWSTKESNSEVQVKLAKQAAEAEGLEVVEKAVSDRGDISTAVNTLKADAIYVPTDNTIVSGLEVVIAAAEKAQIPLIVGEGDSVRRGGIITYGIDYEKLGYQTGEMAVKILTEGADPATMPVESQKDLSVYINKFAAERMGVQVPDELFQGATVVG